MNEPETLKCFFCAKTRPILFFKKDYNRKKELVWRNLCTDGCLQKHENYVKEHRDDILAQKKRYYQENKERHRQYNADNKEKRNERNRQRRQNDPYFAITESAKVRIHSVLQRHKNESSSKLLGCTKEHLLQWLEYQFDDKMNWDNYAEYWQIDHVVPVNFFDVADEKQHCICFGWMNLKPLKKEDNMSKFDHIVQDYIKEHVTTLNNFVLLNDVYQTIYENSWWQRLELWYGNNHGDKDDFQNYLTRTIRSQSSSAS